MVPDLRVRCVGQVADINPQGRYVLYWMTAFRRLGWNFALQRAVDWARDLNKPLLVFEPLRCDYPWASERLHRFAVQGMAANQSSARGRAVTYFPYVEPACGDGKGLFGALAGEACVVIADDYPCFFLPRMIAAAAERSQVRFEAVDSNGLLPVRATDRVFARAFDLRRFLQRELRPHLAEFPDPDPLLDVKLPTLRSVSKKITDRWPIADLDRLIRSDLRGWKSLPIDRSVPPVATAGGADAAEEFLHRFIQERLPSYDTRRNDPQADYASNLSPHLHFGHISAHQVFRELTDSLGWTTARLAERANGSKSGWWGLPPHGEAFLDELITWRELGMNMCAKTDDYDRYQSLPAWARQTLEQHSDDERPYEYDLDTFEAARTHDPLWNAAQRQLVREGRIHNYLRMLWGKKILHWSPTPEAALSVMIQLNNKYALDGRDPNSYSGIFWVLGRYDRAWGPERPVFGKVRYMSSRNTARKLKTKGYVAKYSD